jgi:hypothetical protein
MKPASAKAKGRTFQQEVRKAILDTFPHLEPDDVRSTSMGAQGEDIQLSPAARKALGGVQIECKRTKSFKTIYGWMEQAKSHGAYKPVVIFRADRLEPLVVLPMSDYLSILKGDKK